MVLAPGRIGVDDVDLDGVFDKASEHLTELNNRRDALGRCRCRRLHTVNESISLFVRPPLQPSEHHA